MNDFSILNRFDRVTAPAGFEDRVLAELRARRRKLPGLRRARIFRWSMAGAAAVLLLGVISLNFFVLRGPETPSFNAGLNAAAESEPMPITERVDYRGEIHAASVSPGTVYILEQVSEASNRLIKY